jgi:rhodanese-related sulfurtransferase
MRGAGAAVVDVREAWEVEHCSIEGSIHIPLQTLPGRVDEIPVDRPVIITCHHGGLSMQAVQFLRSRGLEHVTNLEGGIDRWSQEVDPSVPRY